jgi:hypothetical protein
MRREDFQSENKKILKAGHFGCSSRWFMVGCANAVHQLYDVLVILASCTTIITLASVGRDVTVTLTTHPAQWQAHLGKLRVFTYVAAFTMNARGACEAVLQ